MPSGQMNFLAARAEAQPPPTRKHTYPSAHAHTSIIANIAPAPTRNAAPHTMRIPSRCRGRRRMSCCHHRGERGRWQPPIWPGLALHHPPCTQPVPPLIRSSYKLIPSRDRLGYSSTSWPGQIGTSDSSSWSPIASRSHCGRLYLTATI